MSFLPSVANRYLFQRFDLLVFTAHTMAFTLFFFIGVDVTSTQPPSTVTMMKLLASSDFRTTLSKVMEQLKKAGVDLSSKVCNSSCYLDRRVTFSPLNIGRARRDHED